MILAGVVEGAAPEFGNQFFPSESVDPTQTSTTRSFLAVLDGNDGSAVRAGAFGDVNSSIAGLRISFAPGNGLRLMGGFFMGTEHFEKTVLTPSQPGSHGAYMSLIKVEPPAKTPSFDRLDMTTGIVRGEVAVGDFDRDGKPDLILTTLPRAPGQGTYLLRGQGDGTFLAPTLISGACCAVTVADVNGDGNLDLVSTEGDEVFVLPGHGDSAPLTFAVVSPAPVSRRPPILGDFDGDGLLDVALIIDGGGGIAILLGEGDGRFGPATVFQAGEGFEPADAIAVDLNHDGILDLAVISPDLAVLLGNGDGSFQPSTDYRTPPGPFRIVSADFNRDGKVDLAVASFTPGNFAEGGPVSIYFGRGDGTFPPRIDYVVLPAQRPFITAPVPFGPQGIVAGDFNQDGISDLAFGSPFSTLTGNRFGDYFGTEFAAARTEITSMAVADFNLDGKPDVVAIYADTDIISVFLNTTVAPLP